MTDATAIGTRTSATLARLGAATLGESGGVPLDRSLRPVWPGAALAAPCFAVQCAAGDNLAVHVAVAAAPPGHVLAVEVPDDREHGFWGEVLTVAALSRQLAGLVIDACTRDTAALEARCFPVFSTGLALPGAAKVGPGAVGGSATVGGVIVQTGDWLVADVDGIVAIAATEVEAVLEAGEAREAKEATMFDTMSAGATTIELLGLDTGPITRHD
jgi:4-hydroxy-4-methyl-2-oxoglutarate aldolase